MAIVTDPIAISNQVCSCLDRIIDEHINAENSVISLEMGSGEGFMQMVRTGWPGYGMNQDKYFRLDTIDGCNGLRELVNYIMCYEGIYGKILTPEQCNNARYSFDNYPEVVYTEAIQGVSGESDELLEEIEDQCIRHVASRMKGIGRDDYALSAFIVSGV